jgi:Rrf2 family iron-sulfur cluster assembly transcriptional regulator
MTPYGKIAQSAISATSLLAEAYDPKGSKRLNSREIAERRNLSQAIVGKVLTGLSQAGLVLGSPGPGGGYTLACPPAEITLYDIASQFDRMEETLVCPYGPNWCGTGEQCPLHNSLEDLRGRISDYLRNTTFAEFQTKKKPASS